ncbi:MAG: glycosyltransferase family 2 protein [Clostridia bacterium]|nr:glycosyltransferase family 2 protein [Clostridia bacterium]
MGFYSIEKSQLTEYFNWLNEQIGKDSVKAFIDGGFDECDDNAPFLSVVMRTQGKRAEMLREAILCLLSQTNQDFELLIIGHNLDCDGKNAVKGVVSEFPESFTAKVRIIEVNGGTRTTPLNRGFEEANGKYVSCLDDDDLVFDNWVESFYNLYLDNQGKILHAYSVVQDWKLYKTPLGGVPVSVSAYKNMYCCDFDVISQISVNKCPIMSVAFPSYVYHKLNIRFDETLTTTEDWDFLMRTAFLCGVADTKEVTSIYRQWQNNQNSQSLHNKKEWDNNYKTIQKRLYDLYLVRRVSDFDDYVYSVSGETNFGPLGRIEGFVDNGKGFQNNTVKFSTEYYNDCWHVKANGLSKFGELRRIRLDPDDFGMICLTDFRVKVTLKDGTETKVSPNFLRSNYVKIGNKYIFIGYDPQIILDLKKPSECSDIVYRFNFSRNPSLKVLCFAMVKFVFATVFRDSGRFVYRMLKKILRRI